MSSLLNIPNETINDLVLVVLAHSNEEVEKIDLYLDKLEVKSKKLGLTHLEKMEKRYLLSIKRKTTDILHLHHKS